MSDRPADGGPVAPEEASHDVAIVGFGFSGLATLTELILSSDRPLRVAVVAESPQGHGIAYGTRDPAHLLNVPAHDMGARAEDPSDFARWLLTPGSTDASARLGVEHPEDGDAFAPRALYAAYLDTIRDTTLAAAASTGTAVTWVDDPATRLTRRGGAWTVEAGEQRVSAGACVVSTGGEPRRALGPFAHPRLLSGPWDLAGAGVTEWTDPVAIVGSGLTGVDTVLSLRRLGFTGPVRMLSRGGRLPETYDLDAAAYAPDPARVDAITRLADLRGLLADAERDGHPLAEVIQGLRDGIPAFWQRLSADDQREALTTLLPRWNLARHRMAPSVAATVHAQIDAGALTVTAVDDLEPDPDPGAEGGGLTLTITPRGSVDRVRLRVSAIVDCSGAELDPARATRPPWRRLLRDGEVVRHPTGLGVVANGQRIGPRLFAVGSMLIGQRLESIAVPELRAQAATVADALLTRPRA